MTVLLAVLAANILFPGMASAEPVFLPGARWGLTPPPGFEIDAQTRAAFVHPAGAGIMVVTMAQPHDPSRFAAVGVTVGSGVDQGRVVSLDEVEVAGARAWLLRMRMTYAAADVMSLLVSGQTHAMISATIPDQARSAVTDKVVRAALLTAVERTLSVADQIATLPIDIADIEGLRITVMVPGVGVMLTDGPGDETRAAPDQAFVTVIAIPPDEAGGYRFVRDPGAFASHVEASFRGAKVTSASNTQGKHGTYSELALRTEAEGVVRPGAAWCFVAGSTMVLVVAELSVGGADMERYVRLRDSITAR